MGKDPFYSDQLKEPTLAGDGWKLELNNQIAVFVKMLRACLRSVNEVWQVVCGRWTTARYKEYFHTNRARRDVIYSSLITALSSERLGAIVESGCCKGSNKALTFSLKAITGMSKNRDPNAPISLDAAERNELLADPELVELREAKAKLVKRVQDETTKLLCLETDDEKTAQQDVILRNSSRAEIRDVQRQHASIVSRETYALVAAKRKFRHGLVAPITRHPTHSNQSNAFPLPRAATSQFHLDLLQPLAAKKISLRTPRPQQLTKLESLIIYNFTLEDAGAVNFTASVNAFLGLPERPFKNCYPGEGPTHDGKCPVCHIETTPANMNKGGGSIASHIHACTMRQLREEVQQQAEEDYKPRTCAWNGCPDKTIWPSRAKFSPHLTAHFENPIFAFRQRGLAGCMWPMDDGKVCGEKGCEDLVTHFAEVQGINACRKIGVKYCAICAESYVIPLAHRFLDARSPVAYSFVDFEGDGALYIVYEG
ncbi:hypothetical protein FB451DRAFT_1399974 [Mycena latifolia]|nr:hypothetical protein FB451DRAFT_1399974 [Mycena latifolia]